MINVHYTMENINFSKYAYFVFPHGTYNDPSIYKGLSHLMEHCLTNTPEFLRALKDGEEKGIEINCLTFNLYTLIGFRTLESNFNYFLEEFKYLLFEVAFSEELVYEQKKLIEEEINYYNRNIDFNLITNFQREIHTENISPVWGNKKNIHDINLETLNTYRNKFYNKSNCLLYANMGKNNEMHITQKRIPNNLPPKSSNYRLKIINSNKNDKLLIGWTIPSIMERYILDFLKIIITDCENNLLEKLCNKINITLYDYHSDYEIYSDFSEFYVIINTNHDNCNLITKGINTLLDMLIVSEKEFEYYKKIYENKILFMLEDEEQLIRFYIRNNMVWNYYFNVDIFIENVKNYNYRDYLELINTLREEFIDVK